MLQSLKVPITDQYVKSTKGCYCGFQMWYTPGYSAYSLCLYMKHMQKLFSTFYIFHVPVWGLTEDSNACLNPSLHAV